MGKNIEHYLSLPYKIEIVKIPKEEGGGYMARLPRFGEMGMVGDGETVEEAIKNLEEVKKERFRFYLKEGLEIPEPEEDIDNYSGRFVVRLPRFLHRELARAAKENGVSLNQYVCTLLAMRYRYYPINAQTDKQPTYRPVQLPKGKNNISPADEYGQAA